MLSQIINAHFSQASDDYLYFIERNYPIKAVLKIIGDRYRLTGIQRSMLLRGIFVNDVSIRRKAKLLNENQLSNLILIIDTYNVLITLISYLEGKLVYISKDGYVRDAAESHGRIKNPDLLNKALELLLQYLKNLNTAKIIFYLDYPVSNSKKLAENIREQLNFYQIEGLVEVVKSADYFLIHSLNGICATSDTSIIDKKENLFDLSFHVIRYHFDHQFVRL